MGEKRIEIVTESMFYTLMAFLAGECSGVEAAAFTERITGGRVHLGAATIYTILGRFESEGVIREIRREGRRRIYALTDKGRNMYEKERLRMEACLADAIKAEKRS
ncbi:MAG: helix-turn-helix transcriptional regulator [Eubacterium sp.]|nr:helix-turn-helix transcriptional regulator [Eubacterium sp.]